MPNDPPPVKGDEVYIIAGSYKNRRAWINAAINRNPPKMRYVIVDMGDGVELATRIKKTSIGPIPDGPSSYEEAAVQQIPDINYHLKKAAYHLAKCQISDFGELSRLFMAMYIEAQVELEALGPTASYYNIQFNSDL